MATLVSDLIARHVIVHGRVQGVGYRDAAVQAAFELGVTGWVRNRIDGTVEIVVQGPAVAVERFLAWCRRGPPLARVAGLSTVTAPVDAALPSFTRRPTG